MNIHWKDWCWSSNTLATWCKELTHVQRPWCLERLKARGKGDDWGWDGGMASLNRWRWVWASSGCWWWTGKPGVLQSMGSQRIRHDWVSELNWFLSCPALNVRLGMFVLFSNPRALERCLTHCWFFISIVELVNKALSLLQSVCSSSLTVIWSDTLS